MPREMTVTAAQFRKAMLRTKDGIRPRPLLNAFEHSIAGLGHDAKIDWEYEPTIHRDCPWVEQALTRIGLTPQEIDILFRQAAAL
jgi:hypothetical protein